MIRNFWQYTVLKTLRKAFWLPIGRFRARAHRPLSKSRQPIMTAYGVRMVENWQDRTFVYCHGGIYGRFLADFLESQTLPFNFVDIGANQGLYSVIAAQNTACQRVVAFEPVNATHDLLIDNIRANGLSQIIRPLKLAIAEHTGTLLITIPEGHSGMASLASSPDRKMAGMMEETIDAVSAHELDELLGGDGPMLVKVDVEGHESVVIRQLLDCSAAARVTTIFYEVDTRWSDGSIIEQQLRTAGFRHFRKVGFGRHFDVMASR